MAASSRFLFLAPLLLSFGLHAQDVRVVTRVVSDTVPAWKTWKEHGFSMNHPGQWSVDRAPSGDTVVVFRSGSPSAAAPSPVSVIVQGVDGKLPPLEKRWKRAKLNNAERIADDPTEAAAAGRSEYRYDAEGTRMRILEQVVEQGDRSYLLTYAAPDTSYGEYLFLAEAMLNSFSATSDQ